MTTIPHATSVGRGGRGDGEGVRVSLGEVTSHHYLCDNITRVEVSSHALGCIGTQSERFSLSLLPSPPPSLPPLSLPPLSSFHLKLQVSSTHTLCSTCSQYVVSHLLSSDSHTGWSIAWDMVCVCVCVCVHTYM